MHVVNMLVLISGYFDNYRLRSGRGLGQDFLYYVVHFTATTGCSYYIIMSTLHIMSTVLMTLQGILTV